MIIVHTYTSWWTTNPVYIIDMKMVMMSQCFHKYLSFFKGRKLSIYTYQMSCYMFGGVYYIHDRYNTLRNNLCILIFLHLTFFTLIFITESAPSTVLKMREPATIMAAFIRWCWRRPLRRRRMRAPTLFPASSLQMRSTCKVNRCWN